MRGRAVVGVLGPLEVRYDGDGRQVGGPRARRVLAALVARSGSFVSLDVLIEDVWGACPPPSARNSLQSHLSRLRGALAPMPIRHQGGAYRLVAGTDDVDALRFEELCRLARRSTSAGRWSEALAGYERALALWRGPAFADLTDVGPAAAWATRLEEGRLAAAEGAIEARVELGRHDEVVGELEGLADAHPWRERVWILLGTALYRQGRQVDALGVLDRLRRRLRDELGLQPGPEVERLELALLRHDPTVSRTAGSSPGTATAVPGGPVPGGAVPVDLEGLRAQRMLGRDGALAEARSCWEAARSGRCSAMFVVGEAGIGKSRLAAELAHDVATDGGVVLYGRATERIDLAYQPFAHALRAVGPGPIEAIGDAAGWLAGVLPAVDGQPGPPDADDRRFRLLEAVGQLLGAVAAPDGLLLVLDDLHCATMPTLGLLEHVLTVSRPRRVMVLGTARDTELRDGSDLDRFLAEIPRRAGAPVPVVRLEGLGADDVAALMRDHGVDAPGQVVHVRDLTAGNPLLVGELMRTAAPEGQLDLGAGSAHAYGSLGDRASGVPGSVARLILARVDRLGDRGTALSWAALIGTDFEYEVLRLVADAPDLLDRLDEAAQAGLVRELSSGRWQFRHALTADALRSRVGPTRRAERHDAIAAALEVAVADDAAIGRIAHHLCNGARPGHTRRAIEASLRAAHRRLIELAPAEALVHVQEGLAALRLDDDRDPRSEAELHLAAGEAHQQQFAERDRVEAADAALEAARRVGSAELLGRAAVLRGSFWTQGRIDSVAVGAIEEALAALDADGAAGTSDPSAADRADDLRARLLSHLTGSLAVSGATAPGREPEALVSLAQDAVRLAGRGDDPVTLLLADSSLAVTLYAGPWAGRQLELADRMAARGGELDAVYGTRWSAAARLALGDRAGFERDADVLCREGARCGLRALHAYGLQCTAALALLDARFDDAEATAARAVAVGRDHENFTRIRLAQQFWVAAERGQLTAIEPIARAVAADSGLPIFTAMLGLVLCATGAADEAARLLDALAANGFGRVPRDILWLATVAACAEIAATVGAAAHAPQLDALLAPYAGQLVVVAGSAFVYGAVDRFRAMVAHLRGDTQAAERRFEAAIDLERRIDAVPVEIRTRYWRLRLLGDADADRWSDLIATGRRLGLGWLDLAPRLHSTR